MSVILEVYKDALNQEIIEGGCCVFNLNRELRFGVVVESRKKVKVAYTHQVIKWDGVKYVILDNLAVSEQWVYNSEVVMIEEDWLFSKLDTDVLTKMATIKGQVMEKVEKVKAAKERKKAREKQKI